MHDVVVLDVDGPIARISMNRPAKRNAANLAMWSMFPAALREADANTDVRVILLGSTTPGMFCAGADISEFEASAGDPAWRATNSMAMGAAQRALTCAPKPTIAVVDGDCVGGGCALALACDIRLASSRARFGITPAKLGLLYPLHDTKLLIDLVGPAEAKRLLFTGDLIAAEEAREIGLVQQVHEVDSLEHAATSLARRISENSTFSTKTIKTVVRRILDGAIDDDAESARLFDAAFAGSDFAEGVAAFRERRAPKFSDL